MPTARQAQKRLAAAGDPQRAKHLQRFFKTGPGQYAEGDRLRGIRVPELRSIARDFGDLDWEELAKLLAARHHEDRFLALVVLVERARRADDRELGRLHRFYLRNRAGVNNWDLVDVSAPMLVGCFVPGRADGTIDRMSRSKNLWDRRIAVVSFHWTIRAGDPEPFLAFAPRFLDEPHDLIRKAVGWMLRESGKVDEPALFRFLDSYAPRLPRTTLRYAIERLSTTSRTRYMEAR